MKRMVVKTQTSVIVLVVSLIISACGETTSVDDGTTTAQNDEGSSELIYDEAAEGGVVRKYEREDREDNGKIKGYPKLDASRVRRIERAGKECGAETEYLPPAVRGESMLNCMYRQGVSELDTERYWNEKGL